MSLIYLDNSATTALSPAVRNAMTEAMDAFGNPSSLHGAGQISAGIVAKAREEVLRAAGFRSADGWHVIFTGSGSEANNLAILGSARAKTHFDSKRILITDSEHPSVTNCAARLAAEGFETVLIPTKKGRIDLEVLEKELKKGAFLVSFMLVNNETGAYYDVECAAGIVRRLCPDALIHCDAVQGFLRVPLPRASSGVDMITVSAHKIHGPKGTGALLVSPGVFRRRQLSPVIYGGGQEEGLRSGTENVVCIAGFGAACREGREAFAANAEKVRVLREYAGEKLSAVGVKVNEPERRADHIISVTLPDIKSQTMLNFLSAEGICVSAGSACSSHDRHLSPVLISFGLTEREADSTIRVSLCADNEKEDIDALCDALSGAMARLVRIKR